MLNNFCICETCETEFAFPPLDADQDCVGAPNLSQVCGLLIVPDAATPPSDWESKAAWEAIVDNDTDGSARYLTGVGGVDTPDKTTVTVAKGYKIISIRDYQLVMEVYNLSNTQYEFLRSLQCNPTSYKFWIQNVSDHIWGGTTGISPSFTDVDFPLGNGEDETERAVLTIDWRSKCDPDRTYIENLSENFAGFAGYANVIGTGAIGEVIGTGATGEVIGY